MKLVLWHIKEDTQHTSMQKSEVHIYTQMHSRDRVLKRTSLLSSLLLGLSPVGIKLMGLTGEQCGFATT